MSNSQYSFVAETVSPQWDMIQMFAEKGMSRSDVMEANSQRLTWTFILCEVIPILLPATFLLVSTIVLILRMDYKKRRDLKHGESSPAKKKYDPFNLSTREFAMRIASNLGMDAFHRCQNILHRGTFLNHLYHSLINIHHQL